MQNRKSALFVATFSILALPALLHAQTFYVPALDVNLGVALTNRAVTGATVTFTARDYAGETIAGAGITNPAMLSLASGGQQAFLPAEIFGSGIAGRTGWIEIQATGGVVSGLFTLFDPPLTFVDGVDFQTVPGGQLIFPKVSPSTQIRVINVGGATTATIRFYRNDGLVAAQATVNLPTMGGVSGTLAELVPGAPDLTGYAVIEKNLILFATETLFGFEVFRDQSDIAMLNGVRPADVIPTAYFPQIGSQAEYTTSVSLVNPIDSPQTVTLTALELKSGGQALSPSTASVARTIPARGRLEESAASLFGFSGDTLITGYLRWETQGTAGLIGGVEFGTVDGRLLAAIPARGAGGSDFFFPHIAEGNGYYTGIAMLNTNPVVSFVTVEAFDREGDAIDRAAFTLAAGERRVQVLTQILPNIGTQNGGYVRLSSSRPIFSFEVFGSTNLSFLADVQAPGPSIPAQANNSLVTASAGAAITTATGGFEIVIPPGALAADTTIQIGAASTQPAAPPGDRIVAVVEAQPSGATFRIPVRLSMALSAGVAPGTEIPVFEFDSGTGVLTPTEFTAVVDESGRNASAFITHFSTFALKLPFDQTTNPEPVISSLSTAGGLINRIANLRISGSGFMPESQVLVNGAPVAKTFVDPLTLDVQLNSGATGPRSITVTNPSPGGGTSNVATFTFSDFVVLNAALGDNQVGLRDMALDDPLTVRVTDPFGNNVDNIAVLFDVVSGGGAVGPTGAVTDVNGLAAVTATLGNPLGMQQFRARSGTYSSEPLIFTATARELLLQDYLSGLTSPVFLTHAGDTMGRRFIVEQSGQIRVVQPGASTSTVFLDISGRVVSGGEQGLLGLAFHPLHAANKRFFVNYTRAGDGATVIAEYKASIDANIADPTETILLTIAQPFANHNGGMIEFGPDGFLYIGMGDGGSGNDPGDRAQNNDELLGKMLRIDVDNPQSGTVLYSSPSSNPFFGATPGRDEIFATGLRNPWRFSFDPATGALYAGDVGQNAIEEVDIVEKGGNYGWNVFEGTTCTGFGPVSCATPGFTPPIAEYSHTGGRCSVTGGYVYRGPLRTLPRGAYIYGDYCTGEIFMLRDGVVTFLMYAGGLISSFGRDESGELYVVLYGGSVRRFTAL